MVFLTFSTSRTREPAAVSLLGENWSAVWTRNTVHTGLFFFFFLPGVFEGGFAFIYFVKCEKWTLQRRGVIRWLLSTLATCTPISRRLCCMRNSAQPDRCSPFGYAETWSPGDPWDMLMWTSPNLLTVRSETCETITVQTDVTYGQCTLLRVRKHASFKYCQCQS